MTRFVDSCYALDVAAATTLPPEAEVESRARGRVRPQTIADYRQLREHRRLPVITEGDESRPKTRADCAGGARPCPWVSCRHHLALDVTFAGSLRVSFPGVELEDLPETCSLDVADRGALALEGVAVLTNVVRERVRQIECKALGQVKLGLLGWAPEDGGSAPLRDLPEYPLRESEPEEEQEPEQESEETAVDWTSVAWRAYERRTRGNGIG